MDLLSWLTGPDTADDAFTSRTMNASSHLGVYRRPNNPQATKGKVSNPGIYSGCKGPSRGGCLAGMRGFEAIQENRTHEIRAARSLSPQKVYRETPLPSWPRAHGAQQFQPSNSSLLRDSSLNTLGGFTQNSGYPQSHQQAYVYEESPKKPYLFRAADVYQSPESNSEPYTKDASVATGKVGSTSSPKTDVTPSTSDHSDVDDLAPRSIHSPSTSDNDAQTPPSSSPGSPEPPNSCSVQDTGSSSDSSEKPQKSSGKEDVVPAKKSPFASLDLQDQGIVKARSCTRNALQLNKSLRSECRNLEDEMSDLTRDLQALRDQLKIHRVQ